MDRSIDPGEHSEESEGGVDDGLDDVDRELYELVEDMVDTHGPGVVVASSIPRDLVIDMMYKHNYPAKDIYAFSKTGVMPHHLSTENNPGASWFRSEQELYLALCSERDNVRNELCEMMLLGVECFTTTDMESRTLELDRLLGWAENLGKRRLMRDASLLAARLAASNCTEALINQSGRWLAHATGDQADAEAVVGWLQGTEPEAGSLGAELLGGSMLLAGLLWNTPEDETRVQKSNVLTSIQYAVATETTIDSSDIL